MNFIINSFILFSLFLTQFHELSHSNIEEHSSQDECVTCTFLSHTPTVIPEVIVFEEPQIYTIFPIIFSQFKTSLSKMVLFSDLRARAPPLHSSI